MKKWMVCIVLLTAGFASAQEEITGAQQTGLIQLGSHFQAWRLEHQSTPINQFSFPLLLAVPIGGRTRLMVSHKPAYTWWQNENRINGPSDTWAQLNVLLAEDRALLNIGMGLPTGKARLNNNQLVLSRLLSRNIFRFSLPAYSQGFQMKAGLAGAYPLSERAILGVGAQYIRKGTYHPVEYTYSYDVGNQTYSTTYSPEYRAGDEVTGQIGLDIMAGPEIKLMFDLMFTRYGRDVLDGTEIFGSGQRLIAEGGAFYRYEDKKYIWGRLLYRMKGKNEIQQGFSLHEEEYNSSGYQFDLDFHGDVTATINSRFAILLNGRFYGDNEYGNGEASIVGGGIGMAYDLNPVSIIDFQIRYYIGTTDDRQTEGMEIITLLKLGF